MAKNRNENMDFPLRCAFCGSEIGQGDLTILDEQANRTVLHISCLHCGASTISILSGSQAGIMSVGIATDLDGDEAKNKFSEKAISADDVINAYELVKSQQANLTKIIKNLD
jgi:hypothetical protein